MGAWIAIVLLMAPAIGAKRRIDPLSKAEMDAASYQLETAARRVLNLGQVDPPKVRGDGAKPASKAECISSLYRIFLVVKPKFTMTPKLAKGADRSINPLRELQRWGFVPTSGPLTSKPAETIELRQFGDSIGYFMLRLAELTHRPDSRYTPGLMNGVLGTDAGGKDKSRRGKSSP